MNFAPPQALTAARPSLLLRRRVLQRATAYLTSVLIAALATGLTEALHQLTGSTRVGSGFLVGIFIAAYAFGTGPALVAALASVVGFYSVVQPQQPAVFVANNLVAFCGIAIAVSVLVGRLRDAARLAEQRRETALKLVQASRDFAELRDEDSIRRLLLHHLTRMCDDEAMVAGSLTDVCDRAGLMSGKLLDSYIQRARTGGTVGTHVIGRWAMRDLIAGGDHFGTAAWRTSRDAGRDGEGPRTETPWSAPSQGEQAPYAVLVDIAAQAIARTRV